MPMIPEGTRFVLPPEWEWRESLKYQLQQLFKSWGYQAVQTPALEIFDAAHPLADKAFKLIDRDGTVLSLRSEYTTAIAQMVSTQPTTQSPLRLQYAGSLWLRTVSSELGRMREFTQVGVEYMGASNPRASAELLMLAQEALQLLGVRFALELGHPGFVHEVLQETGLNESELNHLHNIIGRKATPELAEALQQYKVNSVLSERILQLPELYGGMEVLQHAKTLTQNPEALTRLQRIEDTVALTGKQDYLLDLGMSRRYGYYSGLTFRAYTPDFGLPLLGGGRYAGGAGFAIGLERVMAALGRPETVVTPTVLAMDFASAQWARTQGYVVQYSHLADLDTAKQYAREQGFQGVAIGESIAHV